MKSLLTLSPLLALVAGGLVIMLLEAFAKAKTKAFLGYAALAFLLFSGVFILRSWGLDLAAFEGLITLTPFALILSLAVVIAGLLIVLMSLKYAARKELGQGEYYSLLLFALAGLTVMVTSTNLLVIFLGLEVLSVSSYALAGLIREDSRSVEAATKYFLTGSFASAFLIFGLALLFGAVSSLDAGVVVSHLSNSGGSGALGIWAGLGLVIAGFGFKVALAPFHMWAPDVYEGAPTPVTAFFAVGPKLAGFAVLFRLLAPVWGNRPSTPLMFWFLWGMAALTMVLGNLAALRQKNLKRLLAYSSIAHSGYLLVAVLSGDGTSLIFDLAAYLLMNAGAFCAIIAMRRGDAADVELDDFAGAGFRYPWIGAAFSVFLFSLAGFPPTAGFLAKFYVFSAAVRQGQVGLVIIAVLASLVSVFYYLRIVVTMYMKDPATSAEADAENPALYLVMFLCLYGVFQLGVWPGNLLTVIRQVAGSLF